MIGFKIWYSNKVISGKTFQDWVNAPDQDIQVVMLYEGGIYRKLAVGCDFYCLNEAGELNHGDVLEELSGHIKYGKWTTDEKIAELQEKAMADYEI